MAAIASGCSVFMGLNVLWHMISAVLYSDA
jgi:hypothetical protein